MRHHRSPLIRVMAVVTAVFCINASCPPPPPTDGGTPVTPSSWTDTARQVIDVTSFALPAMRALVPILRLDPQVETIVVRALDAASAQALPAFRVALDTYAREHSTITRCEVRAAADGLATALLGVADALAQAGWDIAPDLRIAIGGIASIIDQLADAPECHVDAGTSSMSTTVEARLRARPATLRPFPPLPQRH